MSCLLNTALVTCSSAVWLCRELKAWRGGRTAAPGSQGQPAPVPHAVVPARRWQHPCLLVHHLACQCAPCACVPACLQGRCEKPACNRGKACCGNVLMQDSKGNYQVTACWADCDGEPCASDDGLPALLVATARQHWLTCADLHCTPQDGAQLQAGCNWAGAAA